MENLSSIKRAKVAVQFSWQILFKKWLQLNISKAIKMLKMEFRSLPQIIYRCQKNTTFILRKGHLTLGDISLLPHFRYNKSLTCWFHVVLISLAGLCTLSLTFVEVTRPTNTRQLFLSSITLNVISISFASIPSQLTKFTKMNVWTYVYLWSGKYPKGPGDPMCTRPPLLRLNQTAITAE